MGKFEKGNNIAKGRPKGSKNKAGQAIREKITTYLTDEGYTDLVNEIRSLEGTDKVNALLKLMKFAVPELKSIDMTATIDEPTKHRTPEEIQQDLKELNGE